MREELIDTSRLSLAEVKALAHTPGGAFGSCRFKLKSLEADRAKYQRLLEVFKAHDVRWFLYNGGNDSADTALKVSQLAASSGYELTCIGVPKTVDNDLALTDCCPGFGSAAKYTAVSVLEAALDVAAMADTSTKVFVYEVMGRHAGWLAAAAGLAGKTAAQAPHIILFPEIAFDEAEIPRPGQSHRGQGRLLRGGGFRRAAAARTASSWPRARAAWTPSAIPNWAASGRRSRPR